MKPILLLLLSLFFLPVSQADTRLSTAEIPDSVKYKGYRLELTNFKKIKEKNNWIRLSFSVVNSGRMNVDMGRKGTEHWVVFKFDRSIYKAKLGGYRNSIKKQLAKEGFKLDAGKSVAQIEIKIPNYLPLPPKRRPAAPVASSNKPKPTTNNRESAANSLSWTPATSGQSVQLTEKGPSNKKITPPQKEVIKKTPCADILFSQVKILKQDDKWATLEYTITNQGEGTFYLFGKKSGQADNLYIKSYLSGVTTLTRGALPISAQPMTDEIRSRNELKKGEKLTARIKIDVRKKTRYMKSLILSLESTQFADECNRKNNSHGIVLN